jgi:fluoride exporter
MMPGLSSWALVLAGGALGAIVRVAITRWFIRHQSGAFPRGTLVVNLSGAFVVGLLAGVMFITSRWDPTDPAFVLLVHGLVGSYTTVSSLGLEWLLLLREGRARAAWAYLAATLIGGIVLVLLGLLLGLTVVARLLMQVTS